MVIISLNFNTYDSSLKKREISNIWFEFDRLNQNQIDVTIIWNRNKITKKQK